MKIEQVKAELAELAMLQKRREELAEAQRIWDAMTPEEQDAERAHLKEKRRVRGGFGALPFLGMVMGMAGAFSYHNTNRRGRW